MTPSSQGAVRVRSGRSQGRFHSVRDRAEPGKRESSPTVFTGQTDSKSRPAPSARYLEGERHPPQQREGFFSVPVHDVLGQDGAACKRRERWPSSAPRERGACPRAGGGPRSALTVLVVQPHAAGPEELQGQAHVVHLLQPADGGHAQPPREVPAARQELHGPPAERDVVT